MRCLRPLAVGLVVGLGACAAHTTDGAEQGTEQDLTGAQHLAANVERARQARAAGQSSADIQRASVHLGNAYWLLELSMLAYQTEPVIRQRLKDMGFAISDFQFFENDCSQLLPTSAVAYYFSTPAYSVLVFRGTLVWQDWETNAEIAKIPWQGPGLVHLGFASRFYSLWKPSTKACGHGGIEALLAQRHRIDPKTGKAPGGPLFVTGHSMGGALATLALAQTQAEVCGDDEGCAKSPLVDTSAVYSFGAPKVGSRTFAHSTAARARGRTPMYRFVNGDDIVTGLPNDDLDVLDPVTMLDPYEHVGYPAEGEHTFQVWLGKNQKMEISTFVLHLLWNANDHLAYDAPLLLQAKARSEYH